MPIGDEIEALVILLQGSPVIQGAMHVSKMKSSGRPHATDNSLSLHVLLPSDRTVILFKNAGFRVQLVESLQVLFINIGLVRPSLPILRVNLSIPQQCYGEGFLSEP
jgi:hypothetical protein